MDAPKDLKEQIEELKATSQEMVAQQDNLQNQVRLMQSTMETLVSTISYLKKQLTGKQVKDSEPDAVPQGYYFLPTDKMLIDALRSKILNLPFLFSNKYRTVNFYDYNPQQLAELYDPGQERVWYFFVKRDKSKVCNSVRTGVHIQVRGGCWRGCDYVRLHIKSKGYHGHKNFFAFMEDRPERLGVWGYYTYWVMQEYSIHSDERFDGWSLCKMYKMDYSTCKRDIEETEFDFDEFEARDPNFELIELKLYHIFGEQLDAQSFDYEDGYEEDTLSCHLRN